MKPVPHAARSACEGKDLAAGVDLSASRTKLADDLINGEGLLWRITKAGLAPSYLFGTIHSTQPEPLEIAHKAADFIDGASAVATELGEVDDLAKANLAAKMLSLALDRDEDTFAGKFDERDVPRIEALAAEIGYPAALAHHFRLWFFAVALSLPRCERIQPADEKGEVDNFLAVTAREKGKKVIGLETADEQIGVIASIDDALATELLREIADSPTISDDAFSTMLRLYGEHRPADILAVLDAQTAMTEEQAKIERAFFDRLLSGRNALMAERAEPLLSEGGVFIAVGALHLPGKKGLIELLRERGYAVEKVW